MRNVLKMSVLVAALMVLLPGVATAHVTVAPTEAPADGYAMLEFAVPHGCDGQATNRLVVDLPPEVISATPEEVPGWEITIKEGKFEKPVEQHGETITEGPQRIVWAGGPLPDHHLQRFGLSVGLRGEVGEEVRFPVVQECEGGGETAWIQKADTDGAEPERPAPTVTLVAAGDGHGGSAGDTGDVTDAESVAAAVESGDDGSGNGLAIAALVVAIVGLLAGGSALLRTRS